MAGTKFYAGDIVRVRGRTVEYDVCGPWTDVTVATSRSTGVRKYLATNKLELIERGSQGKAAEAEGKNA